MVGYCGQKGRRHLISATFARSINVWQIDQTVSLLSHSFIMSTAVVTPSEIYSEVFPCLCVFCSKLPSTVCVWTYPNPLCKAGDGDAESRGRGRQWQTVVSFISLCCGLLALSVLRSSKCVIITDFNVSPDSYRPFYCSDSLNKSEMSPFWLSCSLPKKENREGAKPHNFPALMEGKTREPQQVKADQEVVFGC